MALIDIVKKPFDFTPAGNPVEYIFESARVNGTDVVQRPYSDVWRIFINDFQNVIDGGKIIIDGDEYIFEDNPNMQPTGGFYYDHFRIDNKLLSGTTPVGGFTWTILAQEIINRINSNYNQAGYFALPIGKTLDICSGGVQSSVNEGAGEFTIYIVGRDYGSLLNITTANYGLNTPPTLTHICTGTIGNFNAEYEMFAEVFVEDGRYNIGDWQLVSEARAPKRIIPETPTRGIGFEKYNFYFNIADHARSLFREDLPEPDNILRTCLSSIRRVYIKYGDVVSNTKSHAVSSPVFSLLNAAFPRELNSLYFEKRDYKNLSSTYILEDYFVPTPRKFLNNRINRYIAVSDWEWLYLYVLEAENQVKIHVVATPFSGPAVIFDVALVAGSVGSYEYLDSSNQIQQVPLHAIWTDVGAPAWTGIKEISVFVTDSIGNQISEEIIYTINHFAGCAGSNASGRQTLVFQNQFGLFESCWLANVINTGLDTQKNNFTRDPFADIQQEGRTRQETTIGTISRETITLQTEPLSQADWEFMRLLFESPSVYWIENMQLVPVQITRESFPLMESRNQATQLLIDIVKNTRNSLTGTEHG